MRKILAALLVIVASSTYAESQVIYGPRTESVNGLLQGYRMTTTFKSFHTGYDLSQISVLNSKIEKNAVVVIKNLTTGEEMPFLYSSFSSSGGRTFVFNNFSSAVGFTIHPYSSYSVTMTSSQPFIWYLTNQPMISDRNTGLLDTGGVGIPQYLYFILTLRGTVAQ